ncbi:hypothetical protein OROMI_001774 [Orobanche minor]
MMMRVVCLLIFASSVTAIHAAGNSNPGIIETTCTKCAQRSMTTLPYCLSSLQALPISQLVNLSGLGVVAMELVEENATATTETIQAMLDSGASGDDPFVEDSLEVCQEMYLGAIQAVEEAVNAFQTENYEAANKYMEAVQKVADTCEAEFQEDSGKESPLAEENTNLKELSSIVLCIIQLLSS